MKGLTINFDTRTIVMTRQFAKLAADPFTTEFAKLQEVRTAYPDFKVKRHTIKKNPKKECYKGLTYDYMREYIRTHESEENVESALAELDDMIFISKCHSKRFRYPTIKKWFLETYTEVAIFGTDNNNTEERKAVEVNFSKEEDAEVA